MAEQKGLLGLPAELRNKIYHLVLPDALTTNNQILWRDAIKEQPGFLQVCTKFRNEALPIYYAMITPLVETHAEAIASFQALIQDPVNDLLTHTKVIGFLFSCGQAEGDDGWLFPTPHHAVLAVRPSGGSTPQVMWAHGAFALQDAHRKNGQGRVLYSR